MSYFGDDKRDGRAYLAILNGLERRRDKEIDKVLEEKTNVDNIIETVDMIMDKFEDDAVLFACAISDDEEEDVREAVDRLLYK